MEELLKFFTVVFGSIFTWFEGIYDTPFMFLMVFIMIDYLSSVMSHFINGTVSSSKGFKGFCKKFLIIAIACSAYLMDHMMHAEGWISSTVTIYLVANEGLSIIENVERGGILVPKFLKDRFDSVKEKEENNEMDDISKLQK